MTINFSLTFAALALIFTIIHIVAPRVPLWVAVLLLCLSFLPIR